MGLSDSGSCSVSATLRGQSGGGGETIPPLSSRERSMQHRPKTRSPNLDEPMFVRRNSTAGEGRGKREVASFRVGGGLQPGPPVSPGGECGNLLRLGIASGPPEKLCCWEMCAVWVNLPSFFHDQGLGTITLPPHTDFGSSSHTDPTPANHHHPGEIKPHLSHSPKQFIPTSPRIPPPPQV